MISANTAAIIAESQKSIDDLIQYVDDYKLYVEPEKLIADLMKVQIRLNRIKPGNHTSLVGEAGGLK